MTIEARVDLRSDTVTRPTPAMREAMQRALLGDDVYGDDPTVNALQERAAAMLGFAAALAQRLSAAFRDAGVLASLPASGSLRLVLHLDVDDAGIERLLSAFDAALAAA